MSKGRGGRGGAVRRETKRDQEEEGNKRGSVEGEGERSLAEEGEEVRGERGKEEECQGKRKRRVGRTARVRWW